MLSKHIDKHPQILRTPLIRFILKYQRTSLLILMIAVCVFASIIKSQAKAATTTTTTTTTTVVHSHSSESITFDPFEEVGVLEYVHFAVTVDSSSKTKLTLRSKLGTVALTTDTPRRHKLIMKIGKGTTTYELLYFAPATPHKKATLVATVGHVKYVDHFVINNPEATRPS